MISYGGKGVWGGVAVGVTVGVRSSGWGGRGVTVGTIGDNGCCNNDFVLPSRAGVWVAVCVAVGVGDAVAVGVGVMGIGDGNTWATAGGGVVSVALAVRPVNHQIGVAIIAASAKNEPIATIASRPRGADDRLRV